MEACGWCGDGSGFVGVGGLVSFFVDFGLERVSGAFYVWWQRGEAYVFEYGFGRVVGGDFQQAFAFG